MNRSRSPFRLRDGASCTIVRAPSGLLVPTQNIGLAGLFHVKCYDRRGRLRWEDDAHNMIVSGGLDLTLNCTLRNNTPFTTWYMGLVDNVGFTAFASTDTILVHPGWAENTNYSPSVRNTWTPGAPSSNTIVNGTTCNFVMGSGGGVIRGLFIVSDNTKGGTAGTLFSQAPFSAGNQTANTGDTLQVTYQVSASSTT